VKLVAPYASHLGSDDDLLEDFAPTIRDAFLTPELLQPDNLVVAWGAALTTSTSKDLLSLTQGEQFQISTSMTQDQPPIIPYTLWRH
jgi:hypothetical protein